MTTTMPRVKLTADDVMKVRSLKAANPKMTMVQLRDTLKLDISPKTLGHIVRGTSRANISMQGLEMRPFNHKPQIAARLERKAAKRQGRISRRRQSLEAAVNAVVEAEPPAPIHYVPEFDDMPTPAPEDESVSPLPCDDDTPELTLEVPRNSRGGFQPTPAQVAYIRSEIEDNNRTHKSVADEFSLSLRTLGRIYHGQIKAAS